ncbi:methyltransferase domain-containing protein [Shewanella sp. JM162201]|uniref:Methyltransferase domain-containing protein n=1 Tax=Shewanella jiangmenensis TaxID=2837387 RepID=A0ABS5V822_9GAMM|nr:class I SAM-dependent methyltransferase [Shewanella jiangmenensis]MBT1445997.1 methyltransferase domain-containing protein [Shewanella jiangmenensis]
MVEQTSPWQALPAHPHVRDAVNQTLAPWWPKVFGYHLLKLGALAASLDSSDCSIGHQITLDSAPGFGVQASFSQLPFQNACIDAVLMSLLLEQESDPYRVLREADRLLISGGYLFIVGCNPLSTLFTGKLLPSYRERFPWQGRFFLPSRVRDWLGLLGYQVISDERFFYHPMIGSPERFGFWQDALQAWLPGAGSLYLLVARKIDIPLTPVGVKRKVSQPSWSTATSAGRSSRSLNKHSSSKLISAELISSKLICSELISAELISTELISAELQGNPTGEQTR